VFDGLRAQQRERERERERERKRERERVNVVGTFSTPFNAIIFLASVPPLFRSFRSGAGLKLDRDMFRESCAARSLESMQNY